MWPPCRSPPAAHSSPPATRRDSRSLGARSRSAGRIRHVLVTDPDTQCMYQQTHATQRCVQYLDGEFLLGVGKSLAQSLELIPQLLLQRRVLILSTAKRKRGFIPVMMTNVFDPFHSSLSASSFSLSGACVPRREERTSLSVMPASLSASGARSSSRWCSRRHLSNSTLFCTTIAVSRCPRRTDELGSHAKNARRLWQRRT
jgi:hypothetical protein